MSVVNNGIVHLVRPTSRSESQEKWREGALRFRFQPRGVHANTFTDVRAGTPQAPLTPSAHTTFWSSAGLARESRNTFYRDLAFRALSLVIRTSSLNRDAFRVPLGFYKGLPSQTRVGHAMRRPMNSTLPASAARAHGRPCTRTRAHSATAATQCMFSHDLAQHSRC